jgi:hypothetical protein
VLAAQILLVAAIYGRSVWWVAPPLVLAFVLTAGRRRSRA